MVQTINPRVIQIFTTETINKSMTEYLFEEKNGFAFFKYIRGTLVSQHKDGIIELFKESGTNCDAGFLLTPKGEVSGAIIEIEKIYRNGTSVQTITPCSEIRKKFGLSI